MGSLGKTLENLTNVAILIVCLLIFSLFLSHKWGSHGASSNIAETHFVGKVINPVPGYQWASHPKTLVLALRKNCQYCEASMPFYKRLSSLEREGRLCVHLLAIMPDSRAAGNEALQASGVEIQGVFEEPLASIQVLGTPTLLLLNASGRVEKAWVGQLSADEETRVVAAVSR